MFQYQLLFQDAYKINIFMVNMCIINSHLMLFLQCISNKKRIKHDFFHFLLFYVDKIIAEVKYSSHKLHKKVLTIKCSVSFLNLC